MKTIRFNLLKMHKPITLDIQQVFVKNKDLIIPMFIPSFLNTLNILKIISQTIQKKFLIQAFPLKNTRVKEMY